MLIKADSIQTAQAPKQRFAKKREAIEVASFADVFGEFDMIGALAVSRF